MLITVRRSRKLLDIDRLRFIFYNMSCESTIEQEWQSVDSGKAKIYCTQNILCSNRPNYILICLASVTKAEPNEKVKNAENMTTFSEKLVTDAKILHDLYIKCKDNYISYQIEFNLIKKRLDRYFNEITNLRDPKLDDIIILASLFSSMAFINSEMNASQENLYVIEFYYTQSLTLLKDKELDSKAIILAMHDLIQLYEVYRRLNNPKKYLSCLNKSLDLYLAYTKGQDEFPVPFDIRTIIIEQPVKSSTVHTLNKYFVISLSNLMQLNNNFEHELIDMGKIVTYMHKMLNKIFKIIPLCIEHFAWVTETIRLAEYFLSCDRLIECKSHLCAAYVMIKRCYDEIYMILDAEKFAEYKNCIYMQIQSFICIINITWVKYGLVIFYLSRKQFLQSEEKNIFRKTNISKSKSTTQFNKEFEQLLMFTDKEEELKKFVIMCPYNYITNYNDAKTLFVRILELLKDLKTATFTFVSVEFRAEVAQYTSRAYKYLAFYEHDKSKQVKLQKRRIDVLEDCLKTFHAEDNLENCLFIWFELAIIYSTLLGMMIENLEDDKLTAEELTEINLLVNNSVRYFQLYLSKSEQKNIQDGNNDQFISYFNLRYNKIESYLNLVKKYTK